MKRTLIYPLSLAQLETLPTRQLLGRLKSLQQCESSRSDSDQSNRVIISRDHIEFKETDEWKIACAELKQVLAKREHVAKGSALVEQRRLRARRNRTSERKSGRSGQ